MSRGPFSASEFVATKFSSAAEKAEFGNALLKFLDADCAPELFTNKLYRRLSMTFGHIAHYNRSQFYEEWFASLFCPDSISRTHFAIPVLRRSGIHIFGC